MRRKAMFAQLLKPDNLVSVRHTTTALWKATDEPLSLSMKTRRTKSSMEWIIRSKIVEQSGSVASCFSFSAISVKPATKNSRLSAKKA